MKEASGEGSMTIVTIAIIAALAAAATILVPKIVETIGNKWDTGAAGVVMPVINR